MEGACNVINCLQRCHSVAKLHYGKCRWQFLKVVYKEMIRIDTTEPDKAYSFVSYSNLLKICCLHYPQCNWWSFIRLHTSSSGATKSSMLCMHIYAYTASHICIAHKPFCYESLKSSIEMFQSHVLTLICWFFIEKCFTLWHKYLSTVGSLALCNICIAISGTQKSETTLKISNCVT